jgi:CheY-like chemotaxis protein
LSAENGQIALDTYKKEIANGTTKIRLVLMDCEMPVMDGTTSTKKIREFENQFAS